MRLPALLTRNFRLKAFCGVAAIVTWAGVVYAANPPETRIVTVPVPQSQDLLPAGYVLLTPIAPLQIRISGTQSNLDAFDSSSFVVTPNFRAISTTGNITIPVHVVDNDASVETDSLPTSVRATVDVIGSRVVPVSIVTNPAPPFGYIVVTKTASPASVTVTGPEQELQEPGLQARVTLDLSNQKTNLQTDEPVLLFDASNHPFRDLALAQPTVRVTVTLSSTQVSRSTAVVPQTTGQVAAGHELVGITVDPTVVVINGPRDVLNALDSIPTTVISLSGLTSSRTIQVALDLPAGVTATPQIVSVHFTIISIAPSPTPTAPSSPSPTSP